MASFSIQNYGEDYVNIRVTPSSGYTAYRVFVRLSSDPDDTTFDRWYTGITSRFDVYVDGLEPGTDYTVNVAFNTSATATGSEWLDPKEFTTDGSGGGTSTYYVTLHYRANGGSGAPATQESSTTSDDQYVTFRISWDEPTREGYTFLGWALDDDTATKPEYYPGDNIALWGSESGETYTLYAVWEEAESGGAWIYRNGWQRAIVWIYRNGWQRTSVWVYQNGWRKGV